MVSFNIWTLVLMLVLVLLLVLLAMVAQRLVRNGERPRCQEPSSCANWEKDGSEKARCREPGTFAGRPDDFAEWLFTVEEAVRTLRPRDPVGYASSFLEGSARRWLMAAWGLDGEHRAENWPAFRESLKETFAERHDRELNRLRLIRTHQDPYGVRT